MNNFDIVFPYIITNIEKGYCNDPNDTGGETYMGYSRNNNPNDPVWGLIDNIRYKYPNATNNELTKYLQKNTEITNLITKAYKKKYCDNLKLDGINNIEIFEQIFDTAINCGTSTAIKFAQHILHLPETGISSNDLIQKLNNYEYK